MISLFSCFRIQRLSFLFILLCYKYSDIVQDITSKDERLALSERIIPSMPTATIIRMSSELLLDCGLDVDIVQNVPADGGLSIVSERLRMS